MLPKAPSLSFKINNQELTSLYIFKSLSEGSTSSSLFILLQKDVASKSARITFSDTTVTKSALPKLNECPKVHEDEHIPNSFFPRSISKFIFSENGDFPAKIPVVRFSKPYT